MLHPLPSAPMPMDREAVRIAAETVSSAHRSALPAADVAEALCGSDMRIACDMPLQAAMLLATVWMNQTQWRSSDPRAGVMIVTYTGKAAACLRKAGFDAVTAFAHARGDGASNAGLVIAVDSMDMPRDDLLRLVATPPHVRLLMLDDRDRLKSALPPLR